MTKSNKPTRSVPPPPYSHMAILTRHMLLIMFVMLDLLP